MADYIEKQTIIKSIHSAVYPFFCGAEDVDALSADEKLVLSVNKTICAAIKALPSADVVEVVRCKDCKYYRECGCQRAFVYPEPDDFCSRGERKDDKTSD